MLGALCVLGHALQGFGLVFDDVVFEVVASEVLADGRREVLLAYVGSPRRLGESLGHLKVGIGLRRSIASFTERLILEFLVEINHLLLLCEGEVCVLLRILF